MNLKGAPDDPAIWTQIMKFAIIHHGRCNIVSLDYRITKTGLLEEHLPESKSKKKTECIEILLDGDYEHVLPTKEQIRTLKNILSKIIAEYPKIKIGGHRNIKGSKTNCPGNAFPLNHIRIWANSELEKELDKKTYRLIEKQYRP